MCGDDVYIYGNATDRDVHTLSRILYRYCLESGESINTSKSSLHFNWNTSHQWQAQEILKKINKLARQFFWRQRDDSQALHTICWEKVTLPWKQGGLNIKRSEQMNKALILKAAWQLIMEHKGIWAHIMKEIYFPVQVSLRLSSDQTILSAGGN